MTEFPPVFIGGAGRSGTTLVVDMLGLHPRISPVYETDFVMQLGKLLFSGRERSAADLRAQVTRCMDEWTKPLPLRPHHKREHEQFHHGPHYILFDRPFALERTAELLREALAGRAAQGFRQFVVSLFEEHCRRDGKPRWVNKTPSVRAFSADVGGDFSKHAIYPLRPRRPGHCLFGGHASVGPVRLS